MNQNINFKIVAVSQNNRQYITITDDEITNLNFLSSKEYEDINYLLIKSCDNLIDIRGIASLPNLDSIAIVDCPNLCDNAFTCSEVINKLQRMHKIVLTSLGITSLEFLFSESFGINENLTELRILDHGPHLTGMPARMHEGTTWEAWHYLRKLPSEQLSLLRTAASNAPKAFQFTELETVFSEQCIGAEKASELELFSSNETLKPIWVDHLLKLLSLVDQNKKMEAQFSRFTIGKFPNCEAVFNNFGPATKNHNRIFGEICWTSHY